MSRHFLARLAPVDRTVHIREPGAGIADVKLTRTALDAQRPLVGDDIPVLLGHDGNKRVGRVTGLTVAAGWYVAALQVDPGANELVRCGQPVSVALDLEQTSRTNDWTSIERVHSARLTEVSICRRGAIDGAEVFAVIPPRKPAVARTGEGTVYRSARGEEWLVEPGPGADDFAGGLLAQGFARVR